MSKKTIVNEIMDLFDENEKLKNQILCLTPQLRPNEIVVEGEEDEDSVRQQIADYITLRGQKAILDYHKLFECDNAKVFDEDERKFLPFSTWLSLVEVDDYQVSNLPRIIKDNVPRKELKKVFFLLLQEEYRKRIDSKKVELMREGKEQKKEEPKE